MLKLLVHHGTVGGTSSWTRDVNLGTDIFVILTEVAEIWFPGRFVKMFIGSVSEKDK